MEEKYTYTVEKDRNKVKISIIISSDMFKDEKEKVFKKLSKTVKISGFRPGKAPRNTIEAKLGPALYEETINSLFPKVTSEIVDKESLRPISKVNYLLEKVSENDGLSYKVDFEAYPEIKLPDFAKLGVKKEKVDIGKDEVEMVIKDMFENSQKSQDQSRKSNEGTKKPKDQGKKTKDKDKKEEKKESKPDDQWVRSLKIEGVKTIKDLEEKVKEQINVQKQSKLEEKYLVDLLDKAIKEADIVAPESLIERELENKEKGYRDRIEKLGLKFEDFIKSKETNLEELKKEWREEVEKRIAREILLIEVAKLNDLKVTKEEIEGELSKISDPNLKQQYDTDLGKQYIATVLIQQKATKWIREQAGK